MGELGVGGQRTELEQDPDGQVPEVDVGQRVDLGPVARQQRECEVEDEEESEYRADAQADLAADERSPVPPTTVGWVGWVDWGRVSPRLGHHSLHVGTPGAPNLTCWRVVEPVDEPTADDRASRVAAEPEGNGDQPGGARRGDSRGRNGDQPGGTGPADGAPADGAPAGEATASQVTGHPPVVPATHVTAHEPTTVVSETASERLDREIGPDAPRRDRLFAAASAKGVPLRTILAVDAVVILTWVLYRLLGRLREILLWIFIAAFIALVLNPVVNFLQRHRFRRGTAIGVVFAGAVVAFIGLLGLFGYPLVNSLTHVARSLPTMVQEVQRGHGWLAHTLQRFHLLSWVQRNAPKLESAAHNLSKPALAEGTNLGKAVFSTILSLTTIGFLSLFMLLEAPNLRRSFLGTLRPDRRQLVEDIAHQVSRQVSAYVLGTAALSLMFGLVILVTLLILGVPFALLIGLWVALVAMIPLVGGLIAAVPTVLIAVLHSPTAGLVVAIVFVAFQLVENHFIYPVVMSRSVRMNPLWVLLAVLIGANLGGVFGSALGALTGALVAIPVGGAVQVISRELWERTRASEPATEAGDLQTGMPESGPGAGPGRETGAQPAPQPERPG